MATIKVNVLTDQDGKVIGTAHQVERREDAREGFGGPIAGPGQSIKTVDLPSEVATGANAEELHRQVSEALRRR